MQRALQRLSALTVERVKARGYLHDGGGLYLAHGHAVLDGARRPGVPQDVRRYPAGRPVEAGPLNRRLERPQDRPVVVEHEGPRAFLRGPLEHGTRPGGHPDLGAAFVVLAVAAGFPVVDRASLEVDLEPSQ